MPISNRMPTVTVEYDARGQRRRKTFTDAHAARRFYVAKSRSGKNPVVVGKSSAPDSQPQQKEA